ncbi:MAG: hypothetical protein DCC75_03270 [Proteobacteria bacterium]|nr:MAG: hypothetical protein DCC75_03270 [Pseudomonadota bacterium]
MKGLFRSTLFWMVIVALLLPFVEMVLPREWRLANLMRPVFILAVLGLGLNIVTGFTGLLNLGIAAFMAIGAYSYAILSCEIFPFQLGFWLSALGAAVIGGVFGLLLGLPTLRLRGDYLAIVTLGFGEIVQDVLRNLDVITRGTQGINPLPPPALFGIVFTADSPLPWYYLFLALLSLLVILSLNLEHSRIGRNWTAIREDELAASCMGVNTTLSKLLAFSLGAALAGFAAVAEYPPTESSPPG